jgi:23S rRNA (guanosine2251-2'-O)-methyltransferase
LWVALGTQQKGRLVEILRLATERKIPIEGVPRQKLDELSDSHQGVALEVSSYSYSSVDEILEVASKRAEPHFILVLDLIQNPQNLGVLLRTAEAVGIHGVLIPLARAALVTPAVVTASAGACEHLLIAQVNLAQAITHLKEADAWVIGLEGTPTNPPLDDVDLDRPIALVVGNEGEGIRPLVRSSCDVVANLPMRGRVKSLNAAVAGSIALYMALQARTAGHAAQTKIPS